MPSASASLKGKVAFRIVAAALLLLLLFYVGRPLYWKMSATIHDIRTNKQTVSGGFSQFVNEAQRSMGWLHDESDSGELDEKLSSTRRFLLRQVR